MKVVINYNKATIKELRDITSGSVCAEDIIFDFSDEWDNLQKTAMLMREGVEPYPIIICGNTIPARDVPAQYYAESGVVYLGLIGDGEDKRITTNVVGIEILNGTPTSAVEDVSLDLYNQIMQIMSATQSIAQSVRDDANRGEFDGKDYEITEADYETIAEKVKSDVDSDLTEQISSAKAEIENVGRGKIEAIETQSAQKLNTIGAAGVDALEHINDAKEQSLNAISTTGENATKAVDNEKLAAQLAVQLARDAALSDLEGAADGHLQNIDGEVDARIEPIQEEVNTLKETVENLNPEWKLLTEIDLSENQLGFYLITKADDGEAFECEKVRIVATNVLGTNGANWGVNVRTATKAGTAGNIGGIQGGNIISSTIQKTICTDVEPQVGSDAVSIMSTIKSGAVYSNCESRHTVYTKPFNVGLINHIQVYASGANVFSAGTIKIYGKVK